MNVNRTLVRREWLQHRLGWAVMAVLPTGLAALLLVFGQVEVGGLDELGPRKAAVLGLAAIGLPTLVHLGLFAIGSLIIVAGLARRDHADHSVEFWLSMPAGHGQSLAVPLLVHLLAVPLAALGVGLVSGLVLSLVLLVRVMGLEAWLGLPWVSLLTGMLALVARLALGTVLAVFWVSPIVLAVVLAMAWMKRWGLVALVAGVAAGSVLMDRLLGYPWPWELLTGMVDRARRSLLMAASETTQQPHAPIETVLGLLPGWLAGDAADALQLLLSPGAVAVLASSVLLFALLVHWRRQGASAGS